MHPLDWRSTALPLELEKTSPRIPNFGYLNPATCLFYDFNIMFDRGGVEDTRLEAKAKDTKKLFEDRHSRGQGQECSRPRPRTKDTSVSALQKKKGLHKNFSGDLQKKKKKKRSSQKFFKRSPRKHVFQKNFQALHKILTIQKILLSSNRGQANFRGLEVSRPRPRTSKCVLEDSTSDVWLIILVLYHTCYIKSVITDLLSKS